jgi:hypothetical protein
MTDEQIETSIEQLEAMSNDPGMMRMAMNAFSASDPDVPSSSSSASTGTMDGRAGTMAVGEGMLTDPATLNSTVRTMRRNPELLKRMLDSQGGISASQKEQLTNAINSFAVMDDSRLEGYLRLANMVQKFAIRPVVRTKDALGLSMRTALLILWIIMTLSGCLLVLIAWRWWYGTGSDEVHDMSSVTVDENERPPPIEGFYDGEF